MKTVTEIITKQSAIPQKKNGGMVSLFNPETEEEKNFWPIDAKEALQNGWMVKPERAFLVEPAKTSPVVEAPTAPTIPPVGAEDTYASRKAKRGVQTTESSDETK